jgi:hypothetical protein
VFIGEDKDEYFGRGGTIFSALERTLIMDGKNVTFDCKRHLGNELPELVSASGPQPELPDEFHSFRNYIYLKVGDLAVQNGVVSAADTITVDL